MQRIKQSDTFVSDRDIALRGCLDWKSKVRAF